MGDINFSTGYKGDIVEEYFKPFSSQYMEYWWHFREILQASDRFSAIWKTCGNNAPLSDEDQQQLIGISMLNYTVYLAVVEALTFYDDMNIELHRFLSPFRGFIIRKLWKATYSSLYTAFNALSNIVHIVVYKQSVTKINSKGEISTQTAGSIVNKLRGDADTNLQQLGDLLKKCQDNLEIRTQLDHFWTMWMRLQQGEFLIDKDYKKGQIIVYPDVEAQLKDDALKLTYNHIIELVTTFNEIYRDLASKGGYLDKYFDDRNWYVDYGNFGFYDEQRRPLP